MEAYKVLDDKQEFLKIGSGALYADMFAMKCAIEASGKSNAINEIAFENNVNGIIEFMADRAGCTSDEMRRDVFEKESLSVFFKTGDRIYKVIQDPINETKAMYQPFYGATSPLRDEAANTIFEFIKKSPGYEEGKNSLYSVFNAAMAEAAKADGWEVPQKQQNPSGRGMREIIRETIVEKEKPAFLEGRLQEIIMQAMAQAAIDEMLPRIKERVIEEFGFEPIKHEVTVLQNDYEFEGVVHEKFDEVMHFIANDVPVYMCGPAGSGKNVLTEHCAKSLGLDFYFMNSVTDEFKLTGFIDAGGNYHDTPFFNAFTKGGVFFLDEIDASAPEVLVCINAAIANRYFNFPTGPQSAHENFRVVAAGNTIGTGADAAYTGRLQLDAATLNRFVVVEVGYDRAIDLINADNDNELVEFIRQYREAVSKCGISSVASYRNIKQIKVAEPVLPLEHCLESCLTKEMNRDDINTLVGSGKFSNGNRWFDALKKVKE